MTVRELIEQYKKSVLGVTVALLVALVGWNAMQLREPRVQLPKYAYFSDDDGRTIFADDVTKVGAFDHNGKPAVAAYVFAGKDGTPFVGYLERAMSLEAKVYVEKARREAADQIVAHPTSGPDGVLLTRISEDLEVKRPGDKAWVKASSSSAVNVFAVTAPSGDPPTPVMP